MKGHIESWVVVTRRGEHEIDGGVETIEVDPKIRELIVESQRQHAVGPLSHRAGAQKRNGIDRVDRHDELSRAEVIFRAAGRPIESDPPVSALPPKNIRPPSWRRSPRARQRE